jgi:hypothetical protein
MIIYQYIYTYTGLYLEGQGARGSEDRPGVGGTGGAGVAGPLLLHPLPRLFPLGHLRLAVVVVPDTAVSINSHERW